MEKHFAALKLLDSDTDLKLTETVSYSDTPSSHRICVKQIYKSDNLSNLVRQYSCEQIFDKHAEARQVKVSEAQIDNRKYNNKGHATEPYFDSFKSFNRQVSKNNNILQAPRFIPRRTLDEIRCNVVDNVDANESKFSFYCSTATTDVPNETDHFSYAQLRNSEKTDTGIKRTTVTKNINKNTYRNIKNKFRPLVIKNKVTTRKKMNMCYCSFLTLCILPVITVMFALLLNLNIHAVCNRSILFSNASHELQQKIYGQENAVSRIIEHLNQDFFYLKVLCLIGGTGVGKSYTVEIIAKNFPLKKEIFVHDTLLDRSISGNALNSLDSYQLLIIENLKLKDLNTLSNVIDALSEKIDKCITVIGIFNVEEVNNNLERKIDLIQSTSTILEALANKKIDSLIISYEPLNEKVLESCIVQAAVSSNLRLTLNQINEIKQSLLLSGSGCKGAYAKVQVVGRY